MPIWGIDLGGTKIEGVVLNDDSVPKILVRKRIDTEAAQGYHHIIIRIKLLIDMMAHELGYFPEKIGLGTPGTIDPISGLMKNSNIGSSASDVGFTSRVMSTIGSSGLDLVFAFRDIFLT